MHVLATAGHVDHGKSSLLRKLTGMEPSRLAEEKRRGMTMQLGYVWLTGADGRPIGIVDVPGHADYRIAMLTGASAVDAFIFLCAADDGWMPQSEEHLWALRAFGVRHGVVVVTKKDLVTDARLGDVKGELEVRFFEAFGREVPVVAFSAVSGEGLDDVKAAIDRELALLAPEKDHGRPQMFVDRVFSVQGQGTVVTGTLRDGTLGERQRVEIIPSGKTAPIRALQAYGKSVLTARPNSRVALQLAGIEVADVPKDSQIALSGHAFTTDTVDVAFTAFADYRIHPKKSPEVVVVHGGVRTKAVLRPIDGPYVRLQLECRRWLRFEERLLVVSSGMDRILGAGAVVDESPQRGLKKAAERLPLVQDFSILEYLTLQLAKTGCIPRRAVELQTRFDRAALEETYEELADTFVYLDEWITDQPHLDHWQAEILDLLAGHHKKNPTEEGMPESGVAKRIAVPQEFLRLVIRALKKAGAITQIGPYLKLISHVPRVDRTSLVAQRLTELAADPRVGVLSLFDLGVDDDHKRRILARFVADGHFIRMDERHVMTTPTYRLLADKVLAFLAANGPSNAAAIRDHLAIGRKVVIMLLETMDEQGLTHRTGELRGLNPAKRSAALLSTAPTPREAPS